MGNKRDLLAAFKEIKSRFLAVRQIIVVVVPSPQLVMSQQVSVQDRATASVLLLNVEEPLTLSHAHSSWRQLLAERS